MSANFPPAIPEKQTDAYLRTSATPPNNLNEEKSSIHPTQSAQSPQTTIRSELANLKADLEALLSRASDASERELREAHASTMTKFKSLQASTKNIATEANRKLHQTGDYVKEHPVSFVAIAAGLGLAIGMLMSKR
jgi:ElaB/YqjD/DUF883 family membrane-anchored ribosome-binding protein